MPESTPTIKSPGELNATESLMLFRVLAHHGVGPYPDKRDLLAWACLTCGSICMAESTADRDVFVKNYDFQCCGTTVYWHSSMRQLVDVTKLRLAKKGLS